MAGVPKITEPVGIQTPDVHEWRHSLRLSSSSDAVRNTPSQTMPTVRSRTPSPSTRDRTFLCSQSPSPSSITIVKHSKDVGQTASAKPSVSSILRKSTGNMADLNFSSKTSKSGELANIEAEYIRNLQQQIYFLELEANYLREQTRKATHLHPQMVFEAERMVSKLRDMQGEIDDMNVEMQRKESKISIITAEKDKLESQLHEEEVAREKDKQLLISEVVTLKTEKDRLEQELNHKDSQLLEAKSEIDKSTIALKNSERQIQTLKAQLEQRIEQHRLTQLALDEKRTELVSMEIQLREVEDKYYNSTIQVQDKVTQDLRDDIRFLRQKQKETELSAEKEHYLCDKINEDSSHLVCENATLSQQIFELQKQLEREKKLHENNEQRHSLRISEMVVLRDKESALRLEVEKLCEQLRKEHEKNQCVLDQLSQKETSLSTTELKVNKLQSRINELESLHQGSNTEVAQLKRDKILLVDHVADLQKKVEEKDHTIIELKAEAASIETHLKQAEYQKTLELNAQSQKWEEFGRLAESMRSLSSTMAQTTFPQSRSRLYQF